MTGKLIDTIEVPKGVSVDLRGNDIKVSAGGKENKRHFKSTEFILKQNGEGIEVWSKHQRKDLVAECRTVASHIRNLIKGVGGDYVYTLEVVFSHFPMNVSVKDGFVEINNLAGAKHPRRARIIGKSKVEVKGKDITVKGPNKEEVGQTAANMEQATKIRGKDVRIYQDGIYITGKMHEAKAK
ncbi:MAG: 50S ribosomal protein L6 [archaeon]|nr:50S ribosomal protein L6 [archaeon]